MGEKKPVLNMCANNYLGLAEHPEVLAAAHAGPDRWGYGLSSVRYTSGRGELIEMLRQRSRPYLFSNSVAPSDRVRLDSGAGTADGIDRSA